MILVFRLLVLSFEDNAHETSCKRLFFQTVERKDYDGMIGRKNFSDQPVKNDWRTYVNIRKIAAGQGDDYTSCGLLDYVYFKNY